MVRIRLSRKGRRNRPFYRITAVDRRAKRDGEVIENLGWYDPLVQDWDKAVSINEERVRHWLSVGAQPSETVKDLLARRGVIDAEQRRREVQARIERKKAAKAAESSSAQAAEQEAAAEAS